MPGRRLAWTWALLAALTAAVSAQHRSDDELAGVRITTVCPWPKDVLPGWLPLEVSVHNTRDERVDLAFQLRQAWDYRSSLRSRMRLAPGESRQVTWLLPVQQGAEADFSMTLTFDGERRTWSVVEEGGSRRQAESHTLVAIATESDRLPGTSVTEIQHERLPTDWRAYTSLSRLVLILENGAPGAEALAAIDAWVSAGGVLQVVGDPRRAGLELQERFLDVDLGDVRNYRHGLGWIQTARDVQLDMTPNWGDADPAAPTNTFHYLAPGVFPPQLSYVDTTIRGLRSLPVGLLATILVIVFIIMGPVQFTVLRRKEMPPSRLLVSTPVLGFGFASIILTASLFSHGVAVRESVTSVTWLDQTTHHASTLAKRTVFSGSVFDTDLRYGADTAAMSLSQRSLDSPRYLVDLDTQVLGGSFLPVRAPVDELVASSATARQRLAVVEEAGQLVAVNGLGADIVELWVRDNDGNYHTLADDRLADGGSAVLEPSPGPQGQVLFAGPLTAPQIHRRQTQSRSQPDLGHLAEELPVAAYVARLATSPFVADGGVSREVVQQRHILIGILEP